MPQRRINDAQTERLLSALQSLPYRQALALKLAKKENIKYDSAMRRLQRYVTKGVQKRVYAHAPLDIRRATIKAARRLPVPADYLPKPKSVSQRKPEQLPLPRAPFLAEIPPYIPSKPVKSRKPVERDLPDNYDYRALLAYFDGDADEAAIILSEYGAGPRSAKLLELAAKGVDILNARGVGQLAEAVRDWYDNADINDVRDVDDFSDYLRNVPEWMIEIILEDLAETSSSFAEWMDAARADGMVFRFSGDPNADDLEDSEFWAMWRAAYARSKR